MSALTRPLRHLGIRPLLRQGRLHLHHLMQVITQYGIRVNGDSEAIGQQHQPLLDPDLSVFEGPSSVVIDSAQEGATYAALHAVENPGLAGRNQ
ncbi:hypothetical protein V1318_20730 [Lysobacter sp. CCNWLW3]|uniref:hypothetical protein n=1 Tax=unclassified Lysobacter TaxID=2635362 RepID=UPI002FD1B5DF